MKIEYKLFIVLAVFFAPVGLAYGIFTDWKEPVGPAGLFLSAGLGADDRLLPLGHRAAGCPSAPRTTPAVRSPSRRASTASSARTPGGPCRSAAAAAICFLGLAVGWWLFIIGAAFGVVALVGWTFEYFKGPHAV